MTSSIPESVHCFIKWFEEVQNLLEPRTVIDAVHDDYFEAFQYLIEMVSSVSKWDLEIVELTRITVELVSFISLVSLNNMLGYSEKQVKLLTIVVCNGKFLEMLSRILSFQNKGQPVECSVVAALSVNSVFCRAVMINLPFLGKDRLPGLVSASLSVLNDFPTDHWLVNEFTKVQEKIEKMNKQVKVEEEAREMKAFTEEFELLLHNREAPGDFRKVQIIPTLEELLQNKFPFLQPNKIKGAYENAEHYLGVQFRLVREDFVRPLRKAVEHLVQNKEEYMKPKGKFRNRNVNNIQVYTEITFKRQENEDATHLFTLPFHLGKDVDWNNSTKLLPGVFVLLTSDFCETAIFATVKDPPYKRTREGEDSQRVKELSRGILRLTIESGEDELKANTKYIMLECEAYFEAYRYNLDVLQKINFLNNGEGNPLSKFIVHGGSYSSVNLPSYFEAGHLLQLPVACNPQQRKVFGGEDLLVPLSYQKQDTWPSIQIKTHLQLDDDQYEAYRMALTSELAIIQGPPGTGKTFIGLQIVKTLLDNKGRRGSVPNSPILIACETNHALDQFLELLLTLQRNVKIVRVGSQSESEELNRRTLYHQRRKLRRNKRNYRDEGGILYDETQIRRQVTGMENKIRALQTEVAALENVSGLLNLGKMGVGKQLLGRIPGSLRNILENEEKCTKWLGIEDITRNGFQVSNVMRSWFNISGFQQRRSRLGDAWDPTQKMYFKEGSSTTCFKIAAECSTKLKNIREEFENTRLRSNDIILLELKIRAEARKRMYENKGNLLKIICECFQQRKLDLDGEELVVDNGNGQFSLKNGNDVSNYTMGQRWRIYFRLLEIAAEMGRKTSAEKGKQLKEARLKLKAAKDKVNGWILKGTDIIGMTTTGAAKHHLLLEYAKPEIVIIEEAAEILEARVITSLTKDCKQLILIGDHLQLRPRPTVYELERKYHLNVSLFERMILNGVKMCTLKTQHRMRPEISDLITGSVYKTLYNHPSVREYPHVKGLLKSLFFVTHTQPEKHDPNLMSKSNQHEANFIVGLCEYLLLQGYLPTEITVLAAYNAQVFLLQRLMPVSCSEVEVTSVDSYQGEENKIILLSLVRSNPEDKIGFVGIENRVCVALSRAKHGLFVVGNLNSFINTSKIWQQIHAKLESGQNCGDGLELKCAQHGRITRVQRGSDFFPGGGCGERCNAKMPCSHLCPQICHGFDRSHEGFKCMEPCERKCKVGYHQCQAECSAECPPCKLPVMWRCKSRIHETFLPCDEPCVGLECCQTQTKEASCQLT